MTGAVVLWVVALGMVGWTIRCNHEALKTWRKWRDDWQAVIRFQEIFRQASIDAFGPDKGEQVYADVMVAVGLFTNEETP